MEFCCSYRVNSGAVLKLQQIAEYPAGIVKTQLKFLTEEVWGATSLYFCRVLGDIDVALLCSTLPDAESGEFTRYPFLSQLPSKPVPLTWMEDDMHLFFLFHLASFINFAQELRCSLHICVIFYITWDSNQFSIYLLKNALFAAPNCSSSQMTGFQKLTW